jgi:RNA polymerase sigma-70 factor (ECF subfamily)
MSDTTRQSLLLRLRESGPAREIAWAEFYDLYAPMISSFARRLGACQQEADDLVQEVLKAFFCVTPEFCYDPSRGRFRGYLKTCVLHKLSELRRKRGPHFVGLDQSPEAAEAEADNTWNDVWETEKLHRALALTRQRYANSSDRIKTFRAFELATLLSRSNDEIAAELHMSLDSVRAAKSRVSKALKQAFDSLDETAD